MNIERIHNVADWAALAEDWNGLLESSHSNTPFLTYEFQRAWWDGLGGSEWKGAELNILVGRDENGQLLGIAPLFGVQNKESGGQYLLIGSHEIADYLDLIVRPRDHAFFCQALVEYLAASTQAEWQSLVLYNLLDVSATPRAMETAARSQGWNYQLETLQASPFIRVPDGFEAYLEALDGRQAHEMRRKLRRAARNPSPITVEIIQEAKQLGEALEDLFGLMGKESQKAAFLQRPGMRSQLETIAGAAFQAGWLQLFFLKCGPTRIAAYLNFDYKNQIWAYNAGFDPSFSHLSPGWLIMAEMMKWCIENGREVFDFMRGDEQFKYRFGGIDQFVQKVTVTRSG